MATEQQSLVEALEATEPQAVETASIDVSSWSAYDGADHRQCRNCGAHVSDDFRRVFGAEQDDDGNNVVHGCPGCTDQNKLARVAARGEYDIRSRQIGGGPR